MILSIFLSSKFSEYILNNLAKTNQNSIQLFTVYYNDSLIKYSKFINMGGVIADEGDYSSPLTLFRKENFIKFFENTIKNYLSNN